MTATHRPGTPSPGLDSGLLSPVRAGSPVEAAVSDAAWLQAMLDAEAALARAQHKLGQVPADAARTITDAARADAFDLVDLARRARRAANPVVALVEAFTKLVAQVDPAAAEYVHRGSTSQDIFDTAAMLVARQALDIVLDDLARAAEAAAGLAHAHRSTLTVARTLTQHAVPTTFGLKAAAWVQAAADAHERLQRIRDHGLPVQLGGAAGTLAGYLEYARTDGGATAVGPDTDYATELTGAFAAELGLAAPVLPWHTVRTPIADLASGLSFTSGALGKIAVDVLSLTRTEVSEVAEPGGVGHGASSAMPQKRNPVLATLIRTAALQVPQLGAILVHCMSAEDERPAGAWHAEWLPLRECLRLVGGAAHCTAELLRGLTVDEDRMRGNLDASGGLILAERLAVTLAPSLGKKAAKEALAKAAADCVSLGRPFADVLAEAPEAAAIPPDRLPAMLDPRGYTGAAESLATRAIERYRTPATG